jgi:hypothetical protein
VPGWAVGATRTSGGGSADAATPVPNGTMHAVPIPAGSTSVRLTLPMAVRVEAEQAGGVSVRHLLSAREGWPFPTASR